MPNAIPSPEPARTLDELNMSRASRTLLVDLLDRRRGTILFAGHYGSGRTSTAYAALQHLRDTGQTVITVEAPVERKIRGITQVEAGQEADVKQIMHTLCRVDFDAIFIGDVGDEHRADTVVRQPRVGRQVTATIHADSGIAALLKLTALSTYTPPVVLDDAQAVVTQKCARLLNPDWDTVDPNTKYAGRVPIYEVLIPTPELIEAISTARPLHEIALVLARCPGSAFSADAMSLVTAGLTDMEEVSRISKI